MFIIGFKIEKNSLMHILGDDLGSEGTVSAQTFSSERNKIGDYWVG